MNLFINASPRKHNCYSILKDLMSGDDKLISLGEKNIKHCLGCTSCNEKLPNHCLQQDDMQEIYNDMIKTNKIVIASPIYFSQITSILKNVIDRLNPFCNHELLKNKNVYLIMVGAMSEKDNSKVEDSIKEYFNELGEIFGFNFLYLKTFTSEIDNDVYKNYNNYQDIINELKDKIKKD